MKDFTFIDLFCGIGGFHTSFQKKGAKCIMACDINKYARETYEANYKMKPLGDIWEIAPKSIKKFDILCAGFPCQPFSQAGHHKGFDDERGTLFFQAMKFAKLHKPKIIIFENVPGLLRHDGGKTFERMKSEIQNEGYITTYKLLKCSDYGIPQMRKRVFVVGIREDISLRFPLDQFLNFDEYKKEMTMKEYLGKNYEKTHAYTLRVGGRGSKITNRHNWDSYYITENGEKKVHRLEFKEALKLQGYDENFILKGGKGEKWKQLGNTIPTIFTKMIADKIEKYFTQMKPLKPLVKWSGGKKDEIPKILSHIPEKYKTYIEPFVGGGALYFHLQPKSAVIADVHKELTDFYKIVKHGGGHHIWDFMEEHPNTEEEYYIVRNEMKVENAMDNAKRFYYLRKTCFRGMLRYNKKGGFNVPFGRYKTCNYEILKDKEYEKLLKNTKIYCKNFEYIFKKYDDENNFVFLDPPYDSEFTDYGYCKFGREEHKKLAQCFKTTKNKCLMIIAKTPFIEEQYNGYIVGEYDKKYKFKLHSGRIGDEINANHLIIKNY